MSTQNKLTDEQVVRVLLVRLGYTQGWTKGVRYLRWLDGKGRIMEPIDIESSDELRPVLSTFTDAEWDTLMDNLCGNTKGTRWLSFEQLRYVMSLAPSQLAHAIAEVIQ